MHTGRPSVIKKTGMNKFRLLLILSISATFTSFAQLTTLSPSFILPSEKGYEMKNIAVPQSCESFDLENSKPITGLSLTGNVVLANHKSFARVVLLDKNGNEYLVFEMSRLFNDRDTLSLINYCEETKILPNVYPSKLLFYSSEALIDIDYITLKEGLKEGKKQMELGDYRKLSKQNKQEQVELIVRNINENNKKHNRLWRAEVSDLSLLKWEDRKKILGINGRSSPTGFEYYSSGIFEFGDVEDNQTLLRSSSPYVESFDWRNRHGKNWMTPVKNQSTGNGCWAFAAVGVTEALVNLYFNQKIDYNLSEQEVISCSGCGSNASGGYEGSALNWISSHGISEENSFPFSNSDEPCIIMKSFSELITMNSTSYVHNHTINNNDSVKKALIKYGPLTSGFMYNNGTYHGHSMALVGYATLHEGDTIRYFGSYGQSPNNFVVIQNGDSRIGKTYWIFKNSYGTNRYYEHKGYAYVLFNDQSCFRTPYYATMPITSQIYSEGDIAITDNDGDGYYTWGIGQKPSHCPSWILEQQDGDDNDYSIGPIDDFGNLYDLSTHVSDAVNIATDTTWTTKRYIYNNIIVPSGVTLTIQCDVTFYNGAKITLQGGCLHVNGGYLTNAVIESDSLASSDIIISNGGIIDKAPNTSFKIPGGTTFQLNYGNIQ